MKYIVFSFDDGTVWDVDTIALFNKYGFKATFNLNSELQDFVWYLDGLPIRRLKLEEAKHLYDGHEIASHTLTHPYLDSIDDGRLIYEVDHDIENLENIFHREVRSFAVPFTVCGDREIYLISHHTKATNIRLDQLDTSFSLPIDPYHIKVTAFNIDKALSLFDDFVKDPKAKLFVYAGHSYDFYVANTFDKLEELLIKISSHKEDIKVVTMLEMVNELL